jgi:hypothetical protein
MYKEDIDWRSGPLRDALAGLDAGLKRIEDRPSEQPWFDGLWACEYSEPLLGVAFVAAQTYLVGTVSDVNSIRARRADGLPEQCRRLNKRECYACDSACGATGVTRVQLINAAANYFKHHEDENGLGKETKATLSLVGVIVGVSERTEFPCLEAARLLLGNELNLDCMLTILRGWREHMLATLCGAVSRES